MTGEVSPRGHGDDGVPPAELRASHEDRDRIVELLRSAAGDGRLTAEELDERLERALTARTYGELAALSRDLPAGPGILAGATAGKPKDMVRIDCRSGNAKRNGRWIVPLRIEARVTSGHITLDFTEAVITQPSLQVDASVRSGSLKLLTRPGIVVDTDDVSIGSGRVKVQAPWGPDVPVFLRIQLPAGSAAAASRHARRAGPSGSGFCGAPSPTSSAQRPDTPADSARGGPAAPRPQPSVNGSRVPPLSSTQTDLFSRYSSTAAMPFSRPSPEAP